jgi:hypothetical protein
VRNLRHFERLSLAHKRSSAEAKDFLSIAKELLGLREASTQALWHGNSRQGCVTGGGP